MTGASVDGAFAADLFDGKSARRIPVQVSVEERRLLIVQEGATEEVTFDQLQHADAQQGGEGLVRRDLPGWRLHFPLGLPEAVTDRLPKPAGYGSFIDKVGLVKAGLGFTVISGLLLAGALTAPRWLGPLVPYSVEEMIGDTLVGDLSGITCRTKQGDAALAKLFKQLDLPGQPPVKAQVVDISMVNAVALPGGRILIFAGLLDDAKGPDEIAGVAAHELGHQRKRHVMQAILRQFGLSILTAGASGSLPNQLGQITSLTYTREGEAEADAFAKTQLAKADISPLPTAAFFRQLSKDDIDERWTKLISSHPASKDRAKFFEQGFDKSKTYRPALTAAEWQALSKVCEQDKRPREMDWF